MAILVAAIGLVAVIAYSIFVRRRMATKVTVHEDRAA